MKKLLSLGLVAGTVTSLAASCGADKTVKPTTETKKTETTTETKKPTTTVTKGTVAKGTFKIGSVQSGLKFAKNAANAGATFSQTLSAYLKSIDGSNINLVVADNDPAAVKTAGAEYFNLPSGLFLTSSSNYIESRIHAKDTANADEADHIKLLSDKTQYASKNLDALFVAVADGIHNSQDVYKAVVEDKNFKDTNLFFVGEKAKSQSGASSKVFAGGKVSTATFNDKAAAYIAGFQAAVGAIKYSASEDKYEETSVAFLIGATSNSIDKKRAFAFRRGVESAAAHKDYSAFLKVKFVSKTEDTSKSSKKLFREISEWKTKTDSKSKLYEFSSSDTFSDTDRRVVYIAGASAQDWTGYSKNAQTTADVTNKFYSGDEIGLIGALYNYKDLSAAGADADSLKARDFTRGVWIVLDNAKSRELISGAFADTFTNVDNGPTGLATTKDSLDSWHEAGTADDHENITKFERHDVKFYGSIGKEVAGTNAYLEFALKGLYMGGANYMLGKHTIFGAPLDNSIKLNSGAYDSSQNASFEPWRYSWTSSNGKDSASKAKSRYEDSLKAAWSVELVEDDIVKDSPWMR